MNFLKFLMTSYGAHPSDPRLAKSREKLENVPMKKRRFSCFEPAKPQFAGSFPEMIPNPPRQRRASESFGSLKSYKEEACKMDKIIKEKYEVFFKAPEMYPNYKQEWAHFWNKRSSELLEAGVDPQSYDFRDDWKKSFHARLLDLEFLEKSEMRSKIFKKHMLINPDPESAAKSISPIRLPPSLRLESITPRRSPSWSPSPSKIPIFERLGKGTKRERSTSRHRPFSPGRGSRSARCRWTPSPERKLPVKERLTLMSRSEHRGRHEKGVAGECFGGRIWCLMPRKTRILMGFC